MGYPAFRLIDATGATPTNLTTVSLGSDELSEDLRRSRGGVAHQRYGTVVAARTWKNSKVWKLRLNGVSQAYLESLRPFFEAGAFYFYPDVDVTSVKYSVFWTNNEFNPKYISPDKFALEATIKESTIGTGSPIYIGGGSGDQSIAGNLTVGGDLTVLGSFDITALDTVRSNGNIYVNYDGTDGDSYVYFYNTSDPETEYFQWEETNSRFKTSSNFSTAGNTLGVDADASGVGIVDFSNGAGTLQWTTAGKFQFDDVVHALTFEASSSLWSRGNVVADDNIYINYDGDASDSYLYFYEGATNGAYLKYDNTTQDDFTLSHSLNVVGDVKAYTNLYVNHNGGEGDGVIYFYDGGSPTGQYFFWDDTQAEFRTSTNLNVLGDLNATGVIYSGGVDISTLWGAGGGVTAEDVDAGTFPAGTFIFTDDLHIAGNQLFLDDVADNVANSGIYFGYSTSSHNIRWNGTDSRFRFSTDVEIMNSGTLDVSGAIEGDSWIRSQGSTLCSNLFLNQLGSAATDAVIQFSGSSADPTAPQLRYVESEDNFYFNGQISGHSIYSESASFQTVGAKSYSNIGGKFNNYGQFDFYGATLGTHSGLTHTKSMTIIEPQAGDEVTMWKVDRNILITEVFVVGRGTSCNATWAVRYSDDRSDGSPATIKNAVADSFSLTTGDVYTSFTNEDLADGDIVWLDISATGGTSIDEFHVEVTYRDV